MNKKCRLYNFKCIIGKRRNIDDAEMMALKDTKNTVAVVVRRVGSIESADGRIERAPLAGAMLKRRLQLMIQTAVVHHRHGRSTDAGAGVRSVAGTRTLCHLIIWRHSATWMKGGCAVVAWTVGVGVPRTAAERRRCRVMLVSKLCS